MTRTAPGIGLNDRLVRIFGSSASLRDALALLAAAGLAVALEMFVDLLPMIADWSRQHPTWHLDKLFTLTLVALLALAAKNMTRCRMGRSWMAIRDMDIAAEIIGIRPLTAKLSAFAISSFYIGIAGALWAFTYTSSVEALAFHGEMDEARKVLDKAVEDAGGEESMGARFAAVRRRLDLFGTTFPVPPLDRWLGGAAPAEADVKGKVAVWHLFGWWTSARPVPLEAWIARQAEGASRGLVVLPVTRTSGWDPARSRFRKDRKPVEELPDIEKAVREIGWKGAVGVSFDGALFNALSVRGLPMEVVVGRDGKVVYCHAGNEAGHRFAMLAAERALAAPASPGAPPGGR